MSKFLRICFGIVLMTITLTACNPFGSQSDTAPSKEQTKFGN